MKALTAWQEANEVENTRQICVALCLHQLILEYLKFTWIALLGGSADPVFKGAADPTAMFDPERNAWVSESVRVCWKRNGRREFLFVQLEYLKGEAER